MASSKIEVKWHGLEHLRAKMASLSSEYPKWATTTMQKATLYALSQVPKYPPPSRRKMPFRSERQRRYVIALMQEEGPYSRTGQLGRSLTTDVKSLGGDVVGLIGTNIVYAPWVISEDAVGGRGPQSAYHRGTWWTLQKAIRDAQDGIMRIFREELRKWLGGS